MKQDQQLSQEAIERVSKMEAMLNQASEAIQELSSALDKYEKANDAIIALDQYYGGDEWLSDFEADEAGLFPHDMKRGVLSEDAAWNVLSDYHSLNVRMLEMVAAIMKR